MEDAHHTPKRSTESRRFVIAIHGGVSDSGCLDKEFEAAAKVTLTDTVDLALKLLANGESALQVAEVVVAALEDAAVFNAGKGSAFNALHEHEVSTKSSACFPTSCVSPARGCNCRRLDTTDRSCSCHAINAKPSQGCPPCTRGRPAYIHCRSGCRRIRQVQWP